MKVRCGLPVEWEVVSTSATLVFGPVMSPTPSITVKASGGPAALSTRIFVP
jgi:hypothetical protein